MRLLVLLTALFITAMAAPVPALAAIRFNPPPVTQTGLKVVNITITGADHKPIPFKLELALTGQEQEMGLMGRTSLAADAGMLFLFDQPGEVSFWMKDTLIPLDMLFIDEHGRIFNIHDSAQPNDLTSIPSAGSAKAVIEMAGGNAKARGVKVGDMVKYKAFH